ncbi:alpha/beta-hydrolase [Penicillium odoratum]|uniref:alpha/beta-hydrolase n=1 Tax=Penicillium odoratum TaxID=1167516 RepID=UPI002548C59F|nr:alpha/beta-hydrolase [Penicillium odoratum]KAJ5769087.1 alpha/beta-hydrolase [Penicillium odoratum]
MPVKVNFLSKGLKIVGNLYTPQESASDRKHAAIVVGHPWGGVKEQTAGLYAERLASNGFITLSFDAAYQGESSGEPRGLEDPSQRAEDYRSAVNYLSTRSDVDPERIGAMGVCAGGGYVSFATQTDFRIKAVATVSVVDNGGLMRNGLEGTVAATDRAALIESLRTAGKARIAKARGESPSLGPIVPDNAAEVPDYLPTLFKQGSQYYRTDRGAHCNSVNRFPTRSVDLMADYSSFAFNDLISPRQLLMIARSTADTLYFSKEAFERALEPKELFKIEGKTHIDLYDDTLVTPPKHFNFMTKALYD